MPKIPDSSMSLIRASAEKEAKRLGVSAELHSDDLLLEYITTNFGVETGAASYITGGRVDAGQVVEAIRRLGLTGSLDILEFAAGYGRVTRHLSKMLPTHHLVASDIHPQACEFISEALGVEALVSAHQPEDLAIDKQFDFIFVLSLFSHLPDVSFARWMKVLYSKLKKGGFLLFTTHGPFALDKHPQFYSTIFDEEAGWGYRTESDQPDIEGEEYGSMVVSNPYVYALIKEVGPDARLQSFTSGVWFGAQDEWVIKKVDLPA